MKLDIKILNGERYGHQFSLSAITSSSVPHQWVKENEVIELSLSVPSNYTDAELILYDHKIDISSVTYNDGESTCCFNWLPQKKWGGRQECLFFNYFGVAELTVKLLGQDGSHHYFNFQPIEVLASKANAKNVELMLSYLANLNDDELHSLFQTTKYNAGFKEGSNSPISNLERLEYSFKLLVSLIPNLLRKPISKLLPEQKVIQPNDHHDFNDESLGWLMSNLSVLDECDDIHQSHLRFENRMYRAGALQISQLKESTDVYENRVIHGFVNLLIVETSNQLNSYESIGEDQTTVASPPKGYVSFFEQVNKFKKRLLSEQVNRCESLLDSITNLKFYLDTHLSVSHALTQRPMLTSKAASDLSYRTIFIEFINWYEKSKPDWSVYENLFAIKSIPILFESYCYYRVAETLNDILLTNDRVNSYWQDKYGNEISLLREPVYWMPFNRNVSDSRFINSEGLTVTKTEVRARSHTHKYSHRCPDIVIEVKQPNGEFKLAVLDAKYTTELIASEKRLPECTMKYIHGIHQKGTGKTVVDSMTILFPEQSSPFNSFHVKEHDLLSLDPITPSLQCLGLELSDTPKDKLTLILSKLLESLLPHNELSSEPSSTLEKTV